MILTEHISMPILPQQEGLVCKTSWRFASGRSLLLQSLAALSISRFIFIFET